MATVYFTHGQSATVYFTHGRGTEIPYSILPTLTNGDDIAAWVNSKHGDDPNGDNAFDIGRIIHNTEIANDIRPADNDLVPSFDAIRIFQPPVFGSATVTVDTITYQPSDNYTGLDTIGYVLTNNGEPVAMGTVFMGVYGVSVPSNLTPSFRTIPRLEAIMDQNNDVSLSQYINLGAVPHTFRVVRALDINASIVAGRLRLTPVSALHGVGLARVELELISPDGTTVYDTIVITVNKVRDTSFVQAQIEILINGEVVDEYIEEAYAPDRITLEIDGSYGGIVHNNEPVKVEVRVRRLDENNTEHVVSVRGNLIVKEVV